MYDCSRTFICKQLIDLNVLLLYIISMKPSIRRRLPSQYASMPDPFFSCLPANPLSMVTESPKQKADKMPCILQNEAFADAPGMHNMNRS